MVVEQPVAEAESERIHRPAWGNAHRPIAEAAGKILDGGQGAAGQHFNRARRIRKPAQERSANAAVAELRAGDDLAQIVPVGFDSFHPHRRKGVCESGDCLLARRSMDQHLG